MANKNITFCSRCRGEFSTPAATAKGLCIYCGYTTVVDIQVARGDGSGTLRTGDSSIDATAATGATVT